MPSRSNETLLTALGFTRPVGRLYERLLLHDGRWLTEVAEALDLEPTVLRERMAPLLAAGAVLVSDDRIQVRAPAQVVSSMIQATAASAAIANDRLQEIAAALPLLTPSAGIVGDAPDVGEPIDGEITSGTDWVDLMRTTFRTTVGDVLWLRPDQWRQPWEPDMTGLVADLLAAGRHVRSIYPVRILVDAPDVPRSRAEMGEEVRLLPEVPTRLVVVGTTHALLPEPLGFSASPRSIVRQTGLVELATLAFEQLWSRATPLAAEPAADPDELRRFLLAELARGAQDEQIARRLGLSLRTVRRRVADLLDELGAHSRFQAGVEATRRGWL